MLRPKMIEQGLVMFPVTLEATKEGMLTTANMVFKVVNAENPEEYILVASGGQGADSQDKGIGKAITYAQIETLTAGISPTDSARVANEYIRQWAIDIIEYEVAKDQVNKDIEQLVEDYRRSLYLYEYEQLLVSQRMPQDVADSLLLSFYDTHKHELLLREMILKGVLVIIPKDAPNLIDLRRHLVRLDDSESLEWLEKFVYQYAVGYELFVDNWKVCDEILAFLPIEKRELGKLLRENKHIELEDSLNTYFLEIVEFYPSGSVMPFDYARWDIEKNRILIIS